MFNSFRLHCGLIVASVLCCIALWAQPALAQPAPAQPAPAPKLGDRAWLQERLLKPTLTANEYAELLQHVDVNDFREVYERLRIDARAGNADAIRALIYASRSDDPKVAIPAASILTGLPEIGLDYSQMRDHIGKLKAPDTWKAFQGEVVLGLDAVSRFEMPRSTNDVAVLISGLGSQLGNERSTPDADALRVRLGRIVERGDATTMDGLREVLKSGSVNQVTAVGLLMLDKPSAFTEADFRALKAGLGFDNKRPPLGDFNKASWSASRIAQIMFHQAASREPKVDMSRLRPNELQLLSQFRGIDATLNLQRQLLSFDALRDKIGKGRVELNTVGLPAKVVFADGSTQTFEYYRPALPANAMSFRDLKSPSFQVAYGAPELARVIITDREGKSVYMDRRERAQPGKLETWAIGNTPYEASHGRQVWTGRIQPVGLGVEIENPLEIRRTRPNLEAEVTDKLFDVTRIEDPDGRPMRMTARGQVTKFDYKDGVLQSITLPHGQVIERGPQGFQVPTGDGKVYTAADLHVGKGGIISTSRGTDGKLYLSYMSFDPNDLESRVFELSKERQDFLLKLRDSMVAAGSIPEGTPIERVWELANRGQEIRIHGGLRAIDKLNVLSVQMDRQGGTVRHETLKAARGHFEAARLKLREIDDARLRGDLDAVARLSKQHQGDIESHMQQGVDLLRKYEKDGPGIGEVLNEAWWGFQMKFLHTYDWVVDNPFKAAGLVALTIVAPEIMLGVAVAGMGYEGGKGMGALTYGYMNNDWAHIQHGAQTLGGVGFDGATLAAGAGIAKGYGAFRGVPQVKAVLGRGPKIELPSVFRAPAPKTEAPPPKPDTPPLPKTEAPLPKPEAPPPPKPDTPPLPKTEAPLPKPEAPPPPKPDTPPLPKTEAPLPKPEAPPPPKAEAPAAPATKGRKDVPYEDPRLRRLEPGKEGAGKEGGFAMQRRVIEGGHKIKGEPTPSVNDFAAARREVVAAETLAKRPDVKEVYLGEAAESFLRTEALKAGKPFPKDAQLPDVVAVKGNGEIILAEGKGVNVGHAGDQFASVGKHIGEGRIGEQIVFSSGKPTDFTQGKGGFLESVELRTSAGTEVPKAHLDGLRKNGVMLEKRVTPEGDTIYVRQWKPNGVRVKSEVVPDLAPRPTAPAPAPAPAGPKPEGVVTPYDGPYGAQQHSGKASLDARAAIEAGGVKVYRMGTLGKSAAAEGQFWSFENPLTTPNYGVKYGVPESNLKTADMIEVGVVVPGTKFVTRPAPPPKGEPNMVGGGIEVVVPEGGVRVDAFTTIVPGSFKAPSPKSPGATPAPARAPAPCDRVAAPP